jgi:hypothetical protein
VENVIKMKINIVETQKNGIVLIFSNMTEEISKKYKRIAKKA